MPNVTFTTKTIEVLEDPKVLSAILSYFQYLSIERLLKKWERPKNIDEKKWLELKQNILEKCKGNIDLLRWESMSFNNMSNISKELGKIQCTLDEMPIKIWRVCKADHIADIFIDDNHQEDDVNVTCDITLGNEFQVRFLTLSWTTFDGDLKLKISEKPFISHQFVDVERMNRLAFM